MRDFTLFYYVFTIPVLSSAIEIFLMNKKALGGKENKTYLIPVFMGLVLCTTIIDMQAFYRGEFTSTPMTFPEWIIHNFIAASIGFLWLQINITKSFNVVGRLVRTLSRYYIVVYMVIAIIVYLNDAVTLGFLRHTDVILCTLLLLSAGAVIFDRLTKKTEDTVTTIYVALISVVCGIQYATGLTDYDQMEKMPCFNLTIWMLLGMITIVYAGHKIKAESRQECAVANVPLDEAFDMIAKEYSLTNRELEILSEVYNGNSNSQIAEHLYISENTAKTHVHNLLKKMGASGRMEIVHKVQEYMGTREINNE